MVEFRNSKNVVMSDIKNEIFYSKDGLISYRVDGAFTYRVGYITESDMKKICRERSDLIRFIRHMFEYRWKNIDGIYVMENSPMKWR